MWQRIRAWAFPEACLGCGAAGTALCDGCVAAFRAPLVVRTGTLAVRAAAPYGGLLAAAIVAVKHGGRGGLQPLARLLASLVPPGTILVPAVTLRHRAAERGFDQARELARRAAALRGASVADVLEKRGAAQRGRDRAGRLLAAEAFALRRGAVAPVAALLVDDVVTTGATLRAAAAVLAAAGTRVTGALVLAATPAAETHGDASRSVGV